MLSFGVGIEMHPEDLLEASLCVLTDLESVYIKFPFDYGILDGLLILLNHYITSVGAFYYRDIGLEIKYYVSHY